MRKPSKRSVSNKPDIVEKRKKERVNDTPKDLRKQSRISREAYLGKLLAWIKGLFGLGATVFASIDFASVAKTGSETAGTFTNLFNKMGLQPSAMTGVVAIITVLAIVQGIIQSHIEKYRLEMHKEGETE